ncbi:MBL fold metallo-hydrolase, partial [Leuconostoc lactis]
MELTHFGHAALRIVSDGTTILVDPFITQNPFLNHADELVETLAADFIIVTHPHADHV